VAGEPENSPPGTGWTLDTLHRYLQQQHDDRVTLTDERHKANQEAVQAALAAAEKARDKAETAMDKRFDGVNEFRQTLSDQATSFPTRNEVAAQVEKVTSEAARNTARLAELELRLTSRLDTAGGQVSGAREVQAVARSRTDLNLTALSVLIGAIVLAVSLYAALHH
jgi:hypothetical protein